MLLIQSSLQLLKNSDLLSQVLVYILGITSFLTIIFFSYAIITIIYKINRIKKSLQEMQKDTPSKGAVPSNDKGITNIIQQMIQKQYDEEILFYILNDYIYYETKIKLFFNLCIAIAPLLGLFGTIWGIVNVFIVMQGAFDLNTIGPGIAEALITTLGGLIVAIPAVFFYHILNFYIRQYYDTSHLYYLYAKEHHEKK
jgi:biopolymer transport protein ExbB/TolQ